jgi:hypothetical protein
MQAPLLLSLQYNANFSIINAERGLRPPSNPPVKRIKKEDEKTKRIKKAKRIKKGLKMKNLYCLTAMPYGILPYGKPSAPA